MMQRLEVQAVMKRLEVEDLQPCCLRKTGKDCNTFEVEMETGASHASAQCP